MKRGLGIFVRRLVVIASLAYVGLAAFLMFFESQILFPASGPNVGDWSPPTSFEDVALQADDGTKLHAWYFPLPDARGAVLHLHGNAGNIACRWDAYDDLRDRLRVCVLALDYRGYGKSQGRPHEAGLVQDAEAARAWLAQR
jgi:fermentation-respiration switch protein FrsA (DUF1100 family)